MGALKMLTAALVMASVAPSVFQSYGAGDELVALVVGASFVLGSAIGGIIFVYNHR